MSTISRIRSKIGLTIFSNSNCATRGNPKKENKQALGKIANNVC